MAKILEVRDLQASYGETRILWDISFDVNEGEVLCLLGSNGTGKTTILRAISGLIPVEKGTIKFLNEDLVKLEPHERAEKGIAHIPEGRRLFYNLTVLENLKVAAYTKKARESFKNSLEMISNLFPILKERKNQLAKTLSGGEQQMLAIARGLVLRPKLLILDEPSLGLAPKIIVNVLGLIKQLKERGYTMLLVEQNVMQALQVGDRGYLMQTGRIVRSGRSQELMEDPFVRKTYLGL